MIKYSQVIIGMILLVLIMSGLMFFLQDLNNNFPVEGFSTTNESLSKYNARLDTLSSLANETSEKTLALTDSSGITDKLGAFFSQGYSVLRFAATSMNTALGISSDAIDDVGESVGMGLFTNVLKTAIMSIIIILLVFAIISTLVKREH